MTRASGNISHERPLPAQVPEDLEGLEQAIQLLGAYVQVNGKLRASSLQRLEQLVGRVPSAAFAAEWKTALKELRAELVAQPGRPKSEASQLP